MIHFEDTFPSHLFVEMCYGRENKFGFIYEQKLNHRDFNYLCESYGVFNGCYELAKDLYNYGIYYNFPSNITYTVENNDFINTINISFTKSNISSYMPTLSKIINDKFHPLVLEIGLSEKENITISSIMHELLHAYEDYKRKKELAISISQKAKNIGYFKNNAARKVNSTSLEKALSYILYFITNFERNAYITQIIGEIKASKKTFNNIKEILTFIKSTIPYTYYQNTFKNAEFLCNLKDKSIQSEVLYLTNQLSNHNFETYNQFVKWLSAKIYKCRKKFNNIIPKIAAQQLDIVETFQKPIIELINI